LVDVLTATRLDFSKVVDISARLSRLDPDYVRFSSESGPIDRLVRSSLLAKKRLQSSSRNLDRSCLL